MQTVDGGCDGAVLVALRDGASLDAPPSCAAKGEGAWGAADTTTILILNRRLGLRVAGRAIAMAVAAIALLSLPATAAPRTKPKADDLVVETSASVTITSTQSKFVDAAVTVPVGPKAGLDGLRVKVEALAGQYDYKAASGRTTTASKTQLTGLVGYEWTWTNARFGLFAGPTLGNTGVSPADPARRDTGVEIGAKIVAQAWWQPTARTMASGYASYSTLADAYYLHAKAGYAVFGNVYAGPEMALLGDDTSSQWRVGAHLTGLQLGPVQMSVAGGYLKDQSGKAGTYATVDVRGAF